METGNDWWGVIGWAVVIVGIFWAGYDCGKTKF